MYGTFALYLQVNLLRYKRLISKSSDPEGLTKELRVCTEIICYQQETTMMTNCLALGGPIRLFFAVDFFIILYYCNTKDTNTTRLKLLTTPLTRHYLY